MGTRLALHSLLLGMALVVCLGVFTLYMRPGFLQVLANQLWGCL